MTKVENAMCRQCRHDNPERRLEADYRGDNENRANQQLQHEGVCRTTHDRKECVEARDNNHHDRIERPVTIQARAGGEYPDCDCE